MNQTNPTLLNSIKCDKHLNNDIVAINLNED